jgi:hypothetical protein
MDQQIAQLKKQIADGTEHTASYLASLQGSIADYDKEHKLSETASAYLQTSIDQANSSVNELKDFGARFQDSTKEVSDELLTAGKTALANVQSSLDSIKTKAIEFDQKSRDTASAEAANAKSSLESLVDAARDQGNSFFESISKSFESLQAQISEAATAASDATASATQTPTEKVAETDKQVTGGVGADLYNKGAALVSQGIEYVTSAFQSKPEDKTTADKP